MRQTRRHFLSLSAAAALGLPSFLRARLLGPPRRLNLLILGGTNFVGPYLVSRALERGHRVTLFNRGKSNPELFPELEQLRGDRMRADGLHALGRDRAWDGVIDTWQGDPNAVARSADALAGRAGHYAYVSSIAVYGGDNYRRPGYDEASPMPDAGEMPQPGAAPVSYPRRKRLAEMVIASRFADAHSIHRAHGIVGVDARGRLDNSEIGLSKAWWPVRIARGGEVLAPGDPMDTTQWTDVIDLAEFVIHAMEYGQTGPFNVLATATLRDFFAELRHDAGSDASFTWVGHEFLFSRGVESFVDVPVWVSHHETENAFYQASNQKARNSGLTPRSIARTFGPVRRAFFLHHSDYDFGNPETGFELARREKELLAEWHSR